MFTYMLHELSRAYAPRVEDVLCIGMGVGIVPMQFAREGARVDVVEINAAVVPVAERFFNFEPDKLNVIVGDGRYFVNSTEKKYDAVVLDAFLGDSSPSHLMTREAFAAMRRVLKPEGVLVINSFGENDVATDFFGASLEKTLRAVFGNVRTHLSGNGNVFFVATDQAEWKVRVQPNFDAMHPVVRHSARQAFEGLRQGDPKYGIVLTDDFNPVDFYDAHSRESIRRNLAMSMMQRGEREE
jgi:spermidine synthase